MEYDLVFEGGGAKGIVFVGALNVLEEKGHTPRRLMGTSAGAITATLLAAGYNYAEFKEALAEKLPDGTPRFATFMDVPAEFGESFIEDSLTFTILEYLNIPFVPERIESRMDWALIRQLMKIGAYRQTFSFVELGGLFVGDAFLAWFKEKLGDKDPDFADMTLTDFYERTGKDLTLIASDTTTPEMLVLNHRTAPDCPVAWAVRMSMSIPFVWQEVYWRAAWGTYMSRNITDHVVVDGGLLSNFAIYLFIRTDREVIDLMGSNENSNPLGLLIDETLPVDNSGEAASLINEHNASLLPKVDLKSLQMVQRVSRLVNTMTNAHDIRGIHTYAEKICRLPAKGYGTIEFDMDDSRREALIEAGRRAMLAYFDNE